jgi:purine-nucleoside/S-methyl-5'-thioadenosine phosphorylase / adenosine deaminase
VIDDASAATANLVWRGELLPGLRVAITGRHGGVSKPPYDPLNLGLSIGDDPAAVRKNRQLVARECGIETGQMVWMRQVHGAHASYARPGEAIKVADALYTDLPGVVLSVLAGDCAPVLLADPAAGVVGAAHAGRGGLQAGVVPALVKAMTGAGALPKRMHALIGPVICGGCYGVPAGMQARVADAVPQARCVTRSGDPGLDIRAGIIAQLADLGVCHVRHDARCTAETDGLSSHRRDRQAGRFAALIWRER